MSLFFHYPLLIHHTYHQNITKGMSFFFVIMIKYSTTHTSNITLTHSHPSFYVKHTHVALCILSRFIIVILISRKIYLFCFLLLFLLIFSLFSCICFWFIFNYNVYPDNMKLIKNNSFFFIFTFSITKIQYIVQHLCWFIDIFFHQFKMI